MKNLLIDHNFPTIKAIKKLHKLRGQSLVVVKNKNIFMGIFSFFDLRKSIMNNNITEKTINKIYNKNAKFIFSDELDNKVNTLFNKIKGIIIIPVIDRTTHKVVDVLNYEKLASYKNKKKKKINCPVIIMAGGKGARLKPYTEILPKPLLPINKKPIIKHIIEKFEGYTPSSFIITLNYKSELLKSYFKELKSIFKIKTIVETKPLGTAGSLYFIKNKIKNNFFLSNCDTIINCDYNDFLQFHKKNQNDITLVITKKNFDIPYGVCENSKNHFNFIEKPKYRFKVSTGLYLINKNILNLLKKKEYLDFNELLKRSIYAKKKIGCYEIKNHQWIDAGHLNEFKNSSKNKSK